MPQQTALVVNDSVPAARTFAVAGVSNGFAVWFEKTSAYLQGWLRCQFSLKMPAKPGQPIRHNMKVVLPTAAVSVIDGVSVVTTRTSSISIEAVIAQDATATEKADICAYASNIFNLATYGFKAQIVNTEPTT